MTHISLLYFSWVREKIGRDGEDVPVPAGVKTLQDMALWLIGLGQEYGDAFADLSRLRYAADSVFAGPDTPVAGVKELAIFPPVTGG